MGARVSLPGIKGSEREEDHLSLLLKKGEEIFLHSTTYVFIARCKNYTQRHLTFTVSCLQFPFYSPPRLLLSSFRVRFFPLVLPFLPLFWSFSLVCLLHLLTYCFPCFATHSFPSVLFMLRFIRAGTKAVSKALLNYDSAGCLCPVIYPRTSVFLILLFILFDSLLRIILFLLIH